MGEREPSPDREQEGDRPFVSLGATTRIVEENGRFVVMLNVTSWAPEGDDFPVANNWKRINDYATRREAEVAAHWIEKSANRSHRPPSGF
ncbi:MAG: hypothetical protein AAGJ46_11140 [Planctomycetota bacterium]